MSVYHFETPYPSHVTSVLLTQFPRSAFITFSSGNTVYQLRCVDPKPILAVAVALDDCYQFRIAKLTEQLELGNYRVEIWDEEGEIAAFTVESFELIPIDSV